MPACARQSIYAGFYRLPISTYIIWKRRSTRPRRSSGRCASIIKRTPVVIRGFRFTHSSRFPPWSGKWRLYGIWRFDERHDLRRVRRLAVPRRASRTVDFRQRSEKRMHHLETRRQGGAHARRQVRSLRRTSASRIRANQHWRDKFMRFQRVSCPRCDLESATVI